MPEYNYTDDEKLNLKSKDQKEMKCYLCGINIGDIIDKCWYHFIDIDEHDRHISVPYCPECENIESKKQFEKTIYEEDK